MLWSPPLRQVHSQPMSQHPEHRGCVLLLEDEALIAVALQADLEEVGYTVAGPFMTCAHALAWLSDQRPDFAVLDTVLKDGPCQEVALKLTRQGVPFLVYSGFAGDLNTLPELAHVTWVEKPAMADVLLKALSGLRLQAAATV